MNEKENYLQVLPSHISAMVDHDNGRMNQITWLTRQAFDLESNIFRFVVIKTHSTVDAINLWKEKSKIGTPNPEMDAWFEKCLKNYLAEMEKLSQIASEKIVRILDEAYLK